MDEIGCNILIRGLQWIGVFHLKSDQTDRLPSPSGQ